MYTITGSDGRPYGPVSAEQIRQWHTEGRLDAQTPVRLEGSLEWRPLATYPELTGPVPPFAGPPPITEIGTQDYQLLIGDCLSRGWELVKNNLGILVAGTLLVMVAQGLVQSPGTVGRVLIQSGRHQPSLKIAGALLAAMGGLVAIILAGPLTGGLYWPYLKLLRGQPAEIGDFFAGFTRGFLRLMLCQLVMSLIFAACIVPPAVLLGFGVALQFSQHSSAGVLVLVLGGVLMLAAVVVVIYLSACWFFSIALIVDKQIDFWPAMKLSKQQVRKHWWSVFGLTFCGGLIGAAGLLLCCVGIFFTMPVALASFMCGYEVIFGRRTA